MSKISSALREHWNTIEERGNSFVSNSCQLFFQSHREVKKIHFVVLRKLNNNGSVQVGKCCISAGVWPGFASVSLTAQVIMEVFVLYSTGGVQFVQQPHPCQLIQASSSLRLIRPQYILNDTKPCTWPMYCAAVQLYSAVHGLSSWPLVHCTGGCCCNYINIHYLYPDWVIIISDKSLINSITLTLGCVFHLVTMFQIVVQCPGLCCSLVPFIDPRQPRRLAGGARACLVCTRPLVRHHNIICDQWQERTQEIRPFFTF